MEAVETRGGFRVSLAKRLLCGMALCLTPMAPLWSAESLTLNQVLHAVLEYYPSLQVAELQVQQAYQENARAESRLGWRLNAQAGGARELSFIGAPTDRTNVSAGVERTLRSGASLGVEAGYMREDADQTLTGLPNPLDTSSVDLNLRQPLAKGWGNPDYTQGAIQAEAQAQLAEGSRGEVYDQVALQVIELYYAAAATQARMQNAKQATARAQRLQRFVRGNLDLGLAEETDRLQAQAQLRARQAEYSALLALWEQQRTGLNRLMGRPWQREFVPQDKQPSYPQRKQLESLWRQVQQYNPALKSLQAQIQLAESTIALRRDAHKDNLDVVLSLGGRNRSGDTTTGEIDENETVGAVRLEYQRSLDKRGVDAEWLQAQLERDIALQQKRLQEQNLRYQLASLLGELKAIAAAVESYRSSLASERRKMGDAIRRYRNGRIDTNSLLQFESELYFAELNLEQQRIDLTRKAVELELLRGQLWESPKLRAVVTKQHGASEERKP